MVKEIRLTKGMVAIVDDEDFNEYSRYNWHCIGGRYAARSVGGSKNKKMHYLHRVIANPSEGKVVDHINGNCLDNRRENLRVCTQKENMRNQSKRKNTSSMYKGVVFAKHVKQDRPWEALVYKDGKTYHIDYFDNEHDAARMYNFWAVDLFGEFAKLNVIKD